MTIFLVMASIMALSFLCFVGSIYLCIQETRMQHKDVAEKQKLQNKTGMIFWGMMFVGFLILLLSASVVGTVVF